MKISSFEFIDGGRNAVLDALDDYVRRAVDFDNAKGWRDSDLPALFRAIDSHFSNLIARFSEHDSREEGSAVFRHFPPGTVVVPVND